VTFSNNPPGPLELVALSKEKPVDFDRQNKPGRLDLIAIMTYDAKNKLGGNNDRRESDKLQNPH
jgi:acyl-CoA-binding protein